LPSPTRTMSMYCRRRKQVRRETPLAADNRYATGSRCEPPLRRDAPTGMVPACPGSRSERTGTVSCLRPTQGINCGGALRNSINGRCIPRRSTNGARSDGRAV
jgi:hypothetical protein